MVTRVLTVMTAASTAVMSIMAVPEGLLIPHIHSISDIVSCNVASSNFLRYGQQMVMHITNVEDVIDALGGNELVAELTSNTITAIYNWRANGKFPADTYLLIQDELKSRGRNAPNHLWPIRQPPAIGKRKKRTA